MKCENRPAKVTFFQMICHIHEKIVIQVSNGYLKAVDYCY